MTAEQELKLLTIDEFRAHYTLTKNHITHTDLWDGCGFETTGRELAFVVTQTQNTIWTAIEENGTVCIVSGFRFVNRLYYLVTLEAVPDAIQYMITDL
ncbi:MAG: hypothetical protein F9K23_09780 [Bacteroidetes bacterium]|nr:MAG: hypothetical protein F9K23_09780 [Bacteroidota bacterium]